MNLTVLLTATVYLGQPKINVFDEKIMYYLDEYINDEYNKISDNWETVPVNDKVPSSIKEGEKLPLLVKIVNLYTDYDITQVDDLENFTKTIVDLATAKTDPNHSNLVGRFVDNKDNSVYPIHKRIENKLVSLPKVRKVRSPFEYSQDTEPSKKKGGKIKFINNDDDDDDTSEKKIEQRMKKGSRIKFVNEKDDDDTSEEDDYTDIRNNKQGLLQFIPVILGNIPVIGPIFKPPNDNDASIRIIGGTSAMSFLPINMKFRSG